VPVGVSAARVGVTVATLVGSAVGVAVTADRGVAVAVAFGVLVGAGVRPKLFTSAVVEDPAAKLIAGLTEPKLSIAVAAAKPRRAEALRLKAFLGSFTGLRT
jgi:hypothetical protein